MGKMFSEQLLKSRFIEEKSRDPRGEKEPFFKDAATDKFSVFQCSRQFQFLISSVRNPKPKLCMCFVTRRPHSISGRYPPSRGVLTEAPRLPSLTATLSSRQHTQTLQRSPTAFVSVSFCCFITYSPSPVTIEQRPFHFFADDPTEPDLKLMPPSFLVSLEYNTKDPNIIAGGCYNGQVRNL